MCRTARPSPPATTAGPAEISRRDKPKLEVGRDIPTPQEIARLVQAAKDRMQVLIMTAASTGLRSSELRGLPWRQRADRWNSIGPPKSDSSKRTVPLGSELVLALKEWKLACPKGELDLV